MLKQNYRRDRQNKTNILSNSNSQLDLPATALFGTDGIRGRVGDLLDEALAWQVGFWTGQVLQQQTDNDLSPVIVGQDSRN
ncbi:MAG: phosphoglucosamine mutase, partial [Chroococcidiopsis sp.]